MPPHLQGLQPLSQSPFLCVFCHHPCWLPTSKAVSSPFQPAIIQNRSPSDTVNRKTTFTDQHWLVCLVAQSCLTLRDPTDCSPPGSCVHGILQARILEWVAVSSSRGSSWPRDQIWVSCTAGRFLTEPPVKCHASWTCSSSSRQPKPWPFCDLHWPCAISSLSSSHDPLGVYS